MIFAEQTPPFGKWFPLHADEGVVGKSVIGYPVIYAMRTFHSAILNRDASRTVFLGQRLRNR